MDRGVRQTTARGVTKSEATEAAQQASSRRVWETSLRSTLTLCLEFFCVLFCFLKEAGINHYLVTFPNHNFGSQGVWFTVLRPCGPWHRGL